MNDTPDIQSNPDITLMMPLGGGTTIVEALPEADNLKLQRAFGSAPHLVNGLAPVQPKFDLNAPSPADFLDDEPAPENAPRPPGFR